MHLGFSENLHSHWRLFPSYHIFDFKFCIAVGGALVYHTLVVVVIVGRLMYVPLWSWLQWYFSLSTASHFEKLDVLVGVMELGFG